MSRPNRDPLLDEVVGTILDSKYTIKELAQRTKISPGTIRKWISGATRSPQLLKASAVIRICGKRLRVANR